MKRLAVIAVAFTLMMTWSLIFVPAQAEDFKTWPAANVSDKASSTRPFGPQDTPISTMLNINRVAAWYTANGEQERRLLDGNSGLIYPRGTATAIYSAGYVYGGVFHDGMTPQIRFNGNMYMNGMSPGRILGLRTGAAEDPAAPGVRIWRVRRDYPTADLRQDAAEVSYADTGSVTQEQIDTVRKQYAIDWIEWPANKGAPFYDADGDGQYRPRFTGDTANGVAVPVRFPDADEPGLAGADQVVWFVANDIQVDQPWECPESGIEVQVAIWGYDRADPLGDAIFKSSRVIYKGTAGTPSDATIDSMYFAQWSDPDLGDSGDDLAGCDSLLGLGYVYNGKPDDFRYGSFGLVPPAVGYDILQGPIVPGRSGEDRNHNGIDDGVDFGVSHFERAGPGLINLPMQSFWYHASGGLFADPPYTYNGAIQWYQVVRGLPPNPQGPPDPPPLVDPTTDQPSLFWVSGDPISGHGWIDGSLDNPGDRRFLISSGPFSMAIGDTQEIVVAWIGGLGRDHKNSIEVLRANDAFVQAFFDSALVVSGVGAKPEHFPVGFCLDQNYPNPFNPSTTIRYALPSRSHVNLTVFNTLGQKVATVIEEEMEAGYHEVKFDASKLSSGVYLYQLRSGAYMETRKLIYVK